MQNSTRRDFFKSFKARPIVIPQTSETIFDTYTKKTAGRVAYGQHTARKKPSTSALAEFSGTFGVSEAQHLLRRTQFGAKISEVNQSVKDGLLATIDKLLNYNVNVVLPSPSPLNHYEPTKADTTGVPLGSTWVNGFFSSFTNDNNTVGGNRRQSLRLWQTGVFLNEGNSLREKLTEFWSHFIPVNYDDTMQSFGPNTPIWCYEYNQLMRRNAKGNFITLIKEVSKSNAMIVYLSGQTTSKTIPNENFARELFELFTIGKDNIQENNKYTEEDIKAASKIFSGWRMDKAYDTKPIPVVFNVAYHNQENKVFSSNFGNTSIANQTGANGAKEFDAFFDMLFKFQGTKIANYVIERFYKYFVYYEIDAPTRTNVIEPLAQLLIDSKWEFEPVVRKLFKSQHFFDSINKGVVIKSPNDLMVSTARELNIETNKPGGTTNDQYAIFNTLHSWMVVLEQGVGDVPTVSGNKAYYQAPNFYQNWLNANTIQRRETYLNSFINGFTAGNFKVAFNYVDYIKQFPLATQKDPNLLIDTTIKYLFPFDIDNNFKAETLKKASLLNNQTEDYYWTDAWNAHLAAPTNATALKTVTDRLKAMFSTILRMAEYQMM